jgi:hypothetical protein
MSFSLPRSREEIFWKFKKLENQIFHNFSHWRASVSNENAWRSSTQLIRSNPWLITVEKGVFHLSFACLEGLEVRTLLIGNDIAIYGQSSPTFAHGIKKL